MAQALKEDRALSEIQRRAAFHALLNQWTSNLPYWNRACWFQRILPFVEQDNLYRQLQAYMTGNPPPP